MGLNKHIIISGRVQGVGCRYSAQQKAKELKLVGWVQNLPDGTVELEVEGESDQIDAFIEALKSGFNSFIRVDHIEAHTSKEDKGYRRFSIK